MKGTTWKKMSSVYLRWGWGIIQKLNNCTFKERDGAYRHLSLSASPQSSLETPASHHRTNSDTAPTVAKSGRHNCSQCGYYIYSFSGTALIQWYQLSTIVLLRQFYWVSYWSILLEALFFPHYCQCLFCFCTIEEPIMHGICYIPSTSMLLPC